MSLCEVIFSNQTIINQHFKNKKSMKMKQNLHTCLKGILLLLFLLSGSILPGQTGQNGRTVSGRVTDTQGEPLPGVNIVVKGTTTGTITDVDGNYELNVPDPFNAVLVFKFIGFADSEIPVNGQSRIDVVMEEDVIGLDEVVAVGYGVMRKSDLTGAVSSIKAEEIANNPSNNALEALQGKISGLDMTRTSGQAGSGLSFLLRGERSLQASNAPLILVDGIEYGSSMDINPTDIQSVEVLKDASSTAIYGSRGANGVILITTKRGRPGDTKISVNAYYSFNTLSGMPRFMSGPEYVQLKRDAYASAGEWNGPEDDANIFAPLELEYIQDERFVDWMDLIFHDGATQNYEVAMSGGNDKTVYQLSFGLMDEQGLLETNDAFRRYNGRLTLDHHVKDNLQAGASILYTFKDQDQRYAPFNMAGKILPIAKPYNDDGTVNPYPAPGYTSQMNPLLDDVDGAVTDNYETSRFFGTSFIRWDIVNGLTIETNLGVDHKTLRHGYFYAKQTLNGEDKSSMSGAEITTNRNLTWENTLNYQVNLGRYHDLNALAGTSTIDRRREYFTSSGRDQASPTTGFYDLSSNAGEIQIDSELVEEQMASFFGRLNYKYADRYLLTASVRADGSSVLAEGNKWGYFPSVAAAWRISEEGFMSGASALSNLKLRLSWGESGQSAIEPYSTLGGLGPSTYAFYDAPAYGYYPRDISNPDLKWETTEVMDIGLDFGFRGNRLSATIDYYQSKTRDLLMSRLLPNTTGFSSVMENVGKTEGEGVDFSLSSVNVNTSAVSWNTDFTFTWNRNEIVQLSGGVDRDVANNWFVGEPISVNYDYDQTGIWQLDEADEAAVHGQQPGDIKVADVDGDGEITPDDRVVFNRSPKYTFGLTNRVSYKNVDLSVFIYGRFGHYFDYEYYRLFKSDALENGAAVDYWTEDNPSDKFPGANKDLSYKNRAYYSSLGHVKGDFWKIRDISLAYNFPDKVLSLLNLSKLRFYVTLKNHFTFSDLDDYDPERGGSLNYPLTKQTVFGVNLEF
jgi:TonB-linked SusC/RagA family outer membrane protein